MNDEIMVPRELLERFADGEPCWFDHHGNCINHDRGLDPGEICPNERVRLLLGLEPIR